MQYPCGRQASPAGLNQHVSGCPICREFALALAVASQSSISDRPDRDWIDGLLMMVAHSSQVAVGRALEVDKQTVHRWVRGDVAPPPLRQEQICTATRRMFGNNWRTLK
jgi:hypothetical protein